MERRSLYHSLRVNWQLDPTLQVKPWQVEDYRKIPSEELFSRLARLGLPLDYARFLALSEAEDTPEDFTETLLPDQVEDAETADQIYLIIFELWRRFLSERQTLSLFCDEWDHQIDLYEAGDPASIEGLSDALARFGQILEETEDQGTDPKALYESVLQGCAHDVESFLYDFAASQVEEQNFSYAQEIVETFSPYVKEKHWMRLLDAEILGHSDVEASHIIIQQLLKESAKLNDLEFNLEFLAYLAQIGDERFFLQLTKLIIPELNIEEDFWDLLSSCENFFHFKDDEVHEAWVKDLRKGRFKNDPELTLHREDPDLQALQKILFH